MKELHDSPWFRSTLSALVLLALLVAASALASEPAAVKTDPAQLRKAARQLIQPLPETMPGSENDTKLMVDLGRRLFFEKALSANRTMSCNSCHAVDNRRGGVDNEPTSPGAFGKRGGRNSPTVLNAGLHFTQFWDGRAGDLIEQAKGPILNPIEMAMPDPEEVLKRLRSHGEYPALFAKTFPQSAEKITYDNVARAIAAFERTLITRDRFDDFLKGDDRALTVTELQGLDLFLNTGCSTCHNGPLLGGTTFQKVGLINPYKDTSDLGRYEVTKDEDDKFKFKVPALRNIALTAPYFHDGKTAKLEEAVRSMGWMQLGTELKTDEVRSIVEFLKSLTDKPRSIREEAKAAPAK